MAPNNERLLALVGQITLFPESHRQTDWMRTTDKTTGQEIKSSCGTQACCAGWACVLFLPDEAVYIGSSSSVYLPNPNGQIGFDPDDQPHHIEYIDKFVPRSKRYDRKDIQTVGREVLGLSDEQASYLFAGDRTKDQLLNAIKYLLTHPNASRYDLAYQAN